MKRFLLFALLFALVTPVNAAVLDITFRPAAGDYIAAGDFTNTWDEIEAVVNNIDASNITDSSITGAKLAPGAISLNNLSSDIAGFATVGAIQMYAGTTQTDTMTTSGWFICDGRAISRTTYATLYSIVGVTYGPGNGSTTFNVPDFRARTAVGACTAVIPADAGDTEDTRSIRTVGDTGGVEYHTLTSGEMGSHTHQITVGSGANAGSPASTSPNVTEVNNAITGQTRHKNMQPFIVVNYIIYAGRP